MRNPVRQRRMRSVAPPWPLVLIGIAIRTDCMTARALLERYFALPSGYVSAGDLAEVPPDVWFVLEESRSYSSPIQVRTHEVTFDGRVTLWEERIRTWHSEDSEPRSAHALMRRTQRALGP